MNDNIKQKVQNLKADGSVFIANGNIDYDGKNERIDLQTVIKKESERLKKQTILPWFSDSKSYCELFPRLFIKPKLTGKTGNSIGYDDLKAYYGQNIAILGEAGAGKTTLLIYSFVFDTKNPDRNYLYLTAKDALAMVEGNVTYVERICQSAEKSGLESLKILIDGIDEEFLNDYKGYINFLVLLKRLSDGRPCSFGLGCRKDLFDQYRGEASQFVEEEFMISPWDLEKQAIPYIQTYGLIVGCRNLQDKISRIIDREELVDIFLKNPFQLSLLVYIAEDNKDDSAEIRNAYELYDKFFDVWFNKERCRGTTEASIRTEIYPRLLEIAKKIYENSTVEEEDIDDRNSAIRNLLVIKRNSYRGDQITAMYHRSIVSFLMADLLIQNMMDDTKTKELLELFKMRIQDDVTNFVGGKYEFMEEKDKKKVKDNLIRLYNEVKNNQNKKDGFVVMEKCIYHLTRMNRKGLDNDVTDFLKRELDPEPKNLYMRLTLAYGSALSDDETMRNFALKYAKSISEETEDAIVNRSWTLVYFGDVADDPYFYRDDKKCSWSKARAARINRFTKKNPRLKDYRFQLFDVPLLYSFLKDREWNEISDEEYQIINRLTFTEEYFSQNEITFLSEMKQKLLNDYREQLMLRKT